MRTPPRSCQHDSNGYSCGEGVNSTLIGPSLLVSLPARTGDVQTLACPAPDLGKQEWMAKQPQQAGARGSDSRWPLLIMMCVGYFLVLLEVTIVNVALPKIGAGLGSSVQGLQWVVDGYAIALASMMLAGGTVGDLHGHKRAVLTGLAVFGVGSLGCSLAASVASLVAARIVQGLGAALLLPGTLAIISHAFPRPCGAGEGDRH